MTSLVAVLGSGRGSWAALGEIIRKEPWDKVFLVTNEFGRQNYEKRIKSDKETEFLVLNFEGSIREMSEKIVSFLDGKIPDLEVGVCLISGEGREHTALISAVLKLGLSMRIVALSEDGSVIEP
ncbi:MAG: hypothetical protein QXW00_02675 [Candidatus Woesearchaeota archaeon]